MERLFKYILDHESEATEDDVYTYSMIFPRWYKEKHPTFNDHPWTEIRFDPLDNWSQQHMKIGTAIVIPGYSRLHYKLNYYILHDHTMDKPYLYCDTWNGMTLIVDNGYNDVVLDMDFFSENRVMHYYHSGTKFEKCWIRNAYFYFDEERYDEYLESAKDD